MKPTLKREPLSAEEFNELCRSVGWKPVPAENYVAAVAESIAIASAFVDNKPAGSGRLVGDRAMYLYIQDVVVRQQFQGRGIGAAIVAELEEVAKSLSPWRHRIGLVAAMDVCPFYEQLGYSELTPPSKLMVKTFD